MFDGIRFELPHQDWEFWLNHETLDFHGAYSLNTGAVKGGSCAVTYQGLRFELKETNDKGLLLKVRGSLPKFYNKGAVGYDDLNYHEMREVLLQLEALGIPINRSRITNIELGFNVYLDYTTARVLKSFKYTEEAEFSFEKNDNFQGTICKRNDYELKVYDKAKVFQIKDLEVIRLEIKARKMRFFKEAEIVFLSDLLDPVKSQIAFSKWLDIFKKITFSYYSFEQIEMLNEQDQLHLYRWESPEHWERLRHKPSALKTLKEERRRFRIFIQRTGGDSKFDSILSEVCEMYERNWVAKLGT
ncbi:hypothetical protein [Sediminitomix flava]|uniref:Replication initiation factor n=1 Tax=Sediminitomix flava TaxID=379075 RepID=A0A315ZTT1_SEDFL|nr:hypothetical protein [Sediminitomix flava]PWJ38644.1 hypothetical protein BC781_107235 [Sediminitomix flava]